MLAKLSPGEAARRSVLKMYKDSAQLRGYEWGISDADALRLFAQNCYYCGSPPSNTCKKQFSGHFVYSGIDRLNNDLGYLEGNVVPCCTVCNKAKLTQSHDEFIAWIRKVASHLGISVHARVQ